MADRKSERLGVRGKLAHFESGLRLLGTANTTGAIAAGAAFHAFAQNADVQNSVKLAALLFLFGIFTFVIAYVFLFFTILNIEHSLYKRGESTWPRYLFGKPTKSAEDYRKAAETGFTVAAFSGLASYALFLVGLGMLLIMVIHLARG